MDLSAGINSIEAFSNRPETYIYNADSNVVKPAANMAHVWASLSSHPVLRSTPRCCANRPQHDHTNNIGQTILLMVITLLMSS